MMWRGKKDLKEVGQHNMDAMNLKRGVMMWEEQWEGRAEEEWVERLVYTKDV